MISPSKTQNRPSPVCIISTDAEQENPNKIFLGGIPPQATEKQLEDFFSEYGKVKDVRIVTDRITAESKGYGFVTFDASENVDHLVEKKAIRMYGKKLRVRKAIRRHGSQFEHLSPSQPKRQATIVVPVGQHTTNSAPIPIPSNYQVAQYQCYQPLTPPASPDHFSSKSPQEQEMLPVTGDYSPIVIPSMCPPEFNFLPYNVPSQNQGRTAYLQDYSSCVYMPSLPQFIHHHPVPVFQF
ncbi:deleted in azoospermia-like [Hydractinia symbiolongicarpus]|uniref:deleted in azoospermia-like n=1 Tax=Hydractinia symbiolongicarpus TaxID=13093 RepID=UPI0025512117|nr:deleted in azoospermia-like [Hydractinia symbiolongicarpus]